MKIWLVSVLGWLRGRKTYLLAALLIVATVVLVAAGRLTPESAFATALVFLGLFAASFRSALAAHQAEAIQVLIEVAALGRAAATKNAKAAEVAGLALAADGPQLVQDLKGAAKS